MSQLRALGQRPASPEPEPDPWLPPKARSAGPGAPPPSGRGAGLWRWWTALPGSGWVVPSCLPEGEKSRMGLSRAPEAPLLSVVLGASAVPLPAATQPSQVSLAQAPGATKSLRGGPLGPPGPPSLKQEWFPFLFVCTCGRPQGTWDLSSQARDQNTSPLPWK